MLALCINLKDNPEYEHLTINKIYKVAAVWSQKSISIGVVDNSGRLHYYFKERFILFAESQEKLVKELFT